MKKKFTKGGGREKKGYRMWAANGFTDTWVSKEHRFKNVAGKKRQCRHVFLP